MCSDEIEINAYLFYQLFLLLFSKGIDLTVVVGSNNIKNPKMESRIPVKYYHMHPGYNSTTLQNDIALLQVGTNIVFVLYRENYTRTRGGKKVEVEENSCCKYN